MGGNSFSMPHDKVRQLVAKYENMLQTEKSEYFDIDELVVIAEYYVDKGKPDMSMEVVDYGLKLHPANLDLQICRCQTLVVSGRMMEAEKLLNSLPDQKDREIVFLRAGILLDKNRPDEMETLLHNLAEDEEYSKDTLLDIAYFYLDAGMPDTAYKWAASLFKDYPEETEVKELMLQCAYDSGNYDLSVRLINKDLDENPYNIDGWLDLARCYIALEKTDKALEALGFALSVDDTCLETLGLYVLCYMKENRFQEAMEYGEKIICIDPDNIIALENIATCAMEMEDYDKAIRYLSRTLDECIAKMTTLDKASVYQRRAEAYLKISELEKCKTDLDTALKYDAEDSIVYLTYAAYFLKRGDNNSAAEKIGYAELYAENDEEILKRIVLLYLDCALFNDAARAATRMEVTFDSQTLRKYYYLMAYCYWMAGEKKRNLIKYIVGAIIYTPELTDMGMQTENEFFALIEEVRQMLKTGEISPEDYLEEI